MRNRSVGAFVSAGRAGLPIVLLVLCQALASSTAVAIEAVDRTRHERLMEYNRAYLEEGRKELERGSYLRAIRLLTDVIQRGGDPEAFKLRGRAHYETGAWDKAVSDVSQYLRFQPDDASAYVLRADAFNAGLDHGSALRDLDRALELDAQSLDTLLSRAIASLGLERYASAIKDLETVLERDPANREALTNLGVAHRLAGRPNAARALFQRALQTEADSQWKERLQSWIAALPSGPDRELPVDPDFRPQDAGRIDAKPPKPMDAPEPLSRSDSVLPDRGAHATRGPRQAGLSGVPHEEAAAHHLPTPGQTAQSPLNGTWETAFMGLRLKLQAKQVGENVSGVLWVRGPLGKEDVYNFTGTIRNGAIVASHYEGHVFQGRIGDDRHLVGVVTTKDGTSIPVNFFAR